MSFLRNHSFRHDIFCDAPCILIAANVSILPHTFAVVAIAATAATTTTTNNNTLTFLYESIFCDDNRSSEAFRKSAYTSNVNVFPHTQLAWAFNKKGQTYRKWYHK